VFFDCSVSTVDFRSLGNSLFGTTPLFEIFQVNRISLHFLLRGLKNATSKGWHICVVLGDNKINFISCSIQV